jgi:predicted flap endonuclease-1-like 5' DNA nuclease
MPSAAPNGANGPSPTPSVPPPAPSRRPPAPSERARSLDPTGTPFPPASRPLPLPPARPRLESNPPKDSAELELEVRLSRSARELAEARAALTRSEAERARAERALSAQSAAHSAELAALRSELEQAQAKRVSALEQRIFELERRLGAQRELESRVDELEAQSLEVVSLRVRNAELEAQLAAQLATPAPGEPVDDLKRLRGVGPAFERGLRALGITTFAQIARFTEADIERVARSLKLKPERIVRDDWVGSARAFLAGSEKS